MQKLPLKVFPPDGPQGVFVARELFFARLERRQHRNNDRNVLRSRALAAFLFAADNQRSDMAAPGKFQKADATRAAEFVRRAAEKIAFAQSLDGHFAKPLHGVAKERHFVLL